MFWRRHPPYDYAQRVFGRRRRISLIQRDLVIEEIVSAIPGPVGELLLEALMLPAEDRPGRIGDLYANAETRWFAELLIDLEEDRQLALDFAQALKERPVQQED